MSIAEEGREINHLTVNQSGAEADREKVPDNRLLKDLFTSARCFWRKSAFSNVKDKEVAAMSGKSRNGQRADREIMKGGATKDGSKNQSQVVGTTLGKISPGKAIGTSMTTGRATRTIEMMTGEAIGTKNGNRAQEAVGTMHPQMILTRKRRKKPKKKKPGQKKRQ